MEIQTDRSASLLATFTVAILCQNKISIKLYLRLDFQEQKSGLQQTSFLVDHWTMSNTRPLH